jgi:hypothetical protein
MLGSRIKLSVPLVALGSLAAVACVETGDEAVVILQNQLPEDGCVVSASVTESYLGAGVIDVASQDGYQFTPVAKNFRTATDGGGRTIAFVTGIEVDLSFADPTLFDAASSVELRNQGITQFVVPYAAMIDAGATTSFVVEILPPELIELIAETPQLADAQSSTIVYADVRIVGSLGSLPGRGLQRLRRQQPRPLRPARGAADPARRSVQPGAGPARRLLRGPRWPRLSGGTGHAGAVIRPPLTPAARWPLVR